MKALGTGIGGFALTDVEVCRAAGKGATRNAPYLRLHGTAAELAGAHGVGTFHLSLTHTDGVAIAFVVAEQAPCAPRPETKCGRPTPPPWGPSRTRRWSTAPARRRRTPRSALLGGAYGRRIVVVAGKGSNGADGRVSAAFLAHRGARVRVFEAAAWGVGRLAGVRSRHRRRVRHRVPGSYHAPRGA